MLAEALCKLEDFTYAPGGNEFWQHRHSIESDFTHVKPQTLTRDQLAGLSERVGNKRTLQVLCTVFRAKRLDEFKNLTVKKIPKTIQHRCEWGKYDDSLEIKNFPDVEVVDPAISSVQPAAERRHKIQDEGPPLFLTTERDTMNWQGRLSADPEICHGRLCVKGTRVMVSVILEQVRRRRIVRRHHKRPCGRARRH